MYSSTTESIRILSALTVCNEKRLQPKFRDETIKQPRAITICKSYNSMIHTVSSLLFFFFFFVCLFVCLVGWLVGWLVFVLVSFLFLFVCFLLLLVCVCVCGGGGGGASFLFFFGKLCAYKVDQWKWHLPKWMLSFTLEYTNATSKTTLLTSK